MLKIDVAKRYLETQMAIFEGTMAPDMKEAMKLAVGAMEKQIPKKPTLSDSRSFHICPCSDCNKFISKNEPSHGNIEIPHCKWCGQKLDWSDEND